MTLEAQIRRLLKADISFPESRELLERLRAIDKGRDVTVEHHAGLAFDIYASASNVAVEFMEQILESREFAELEKFVFTTQTAYDPSYPPESPISKSFYNTSLVFDARLNSVGFTVGELFLNYLEERKIMRYVHEALRNLNESYFGFYQVSGVKGKITYLWDFRAKKEYACRCAGEYRGVAGELWYVRILPPLEGREAEWTVLNTPYVFRKTDKEEWLEFFSREGAGKPEGYAEEYLKYGRYPGYWMEFVYQAYVLDYSDGAVYLEGLPDEVESRPRRDLDEDRFPPGEDFDEDEKGSGPPDRDLLSELRGKTREILEKNPDMSMDELNSELSRLTLKQNNTGQDDFDGLSPAEMYEALYRPFESSGVIGFNRGISESECESCCPFYRMTKMLLHEIRRQGTIKITAKGNLPVKYVKEWYATGVSKDQPIELGITKLNRQEDWRFLDAVVKTAKVTGLTKVIHGKLSLTKKGERLIEKKSNDLFFENFKVFCLEFNWAYFDGYSSEQCGQFGFLFSLWLLRKYGKQKRTMLFYSDKYFTAFPDMKGPPSKWGDHSHSCYRHRFFFHFGMWFGLMETENNFKDFFQLDTQAEVTASAFLNSLVRGK